VRGLVNWMWVCSGSAKFLGESFRRVARLERDLAGASSDDSRRLSVPARDSTSLRVDRAFSSPRQPKRVASLSEAWAFLPEQTVRLAYARRAILSANGPS
jgi:hypothetical protein